MAFDCFVVEGIALGVDIPHEHDERRLKIQSPAGLAEPGFRPGLAPSPPPHSPGGVTSVT